MYGIFTYIYPKSVPNVVKYSIHGASGHGSYPHEKTIGGAEYQGVLTTQHPTTLQGKLQSIQAESNNFRLPKGFPVLPAGGSKGSPFDLQIRSAHTEMIRAGKMKSVRKRNLIILNNIDLYRFMMIISLIETFIHSKIEEF